MQTTIIRKPIRVRKVHITFTPIGDVERNACNKYFDTEEEADAWIEEQENTNPKFRLDSFCWCTVPHPLGLCEDVVVENR